MTCPHDWIPPQSCPLCKDAEIERRQGIESKLSARVVDQLVEIERLRAALERIAKVDVDPDLKGRIDVLSGIAWAALHPINNEQKATEKSEPYSYDDTPPSSYGND